MKRNCGWFGVGPAADQGACPTVVWARGGFALSTCPKSYVTAESESLLEDFLLRRRLGGSRVEELSARQTEAFMVLEQAIAEERKHGRTQRHL
jgi:hypothetical protein